jgi:hypothetical protein
VREVSVIRMAGAIVTKWRMEDHVQLVLSVRGQGEEVRLLCTCERGHWIVREHFGEGGPRLIATCHNCGNRVELPLEGARLPNA